MKVAEIVKNGFNNTSFTATKKASNMAMSVSRLINIHKTKTSYDSQLLLLYYFGVCKGIKSFSKQWRNYAVYSKTAVKVNRVDK